MTEKQQSLDASGVLSTFNRAYEIAKNLKHEYVLLEHVLRSLLEEDDVIDILCDLEVDVDDVRDEVDAYLNSGRISTSETEPRGTIAITRVKKKMMMSCIFSGRETINPVDVLVSLFSEERSYAVEILTSHDIEKFDVISQISQNNMEALENTPTVEEPEIIEDVPDAAVPATTSDTSSTRRPKQKKNYYDKVLEAFCVNLNEVANDGTILPLIGRMDEVDQITQVLARRLKNNIILVGEAGVGKAQPLYSSIKTPNGWKLMGDMEIGDVVETPDGETANITGVFPQGKKPIYRLHFNDGRQVDACGEHLWKVYTTNWRRHGDGSGYRIIDTDELIERTRSTSQKYYLPLLTPNKNGNDIDLPFDPYMLGVLIGDGCIKHGHLDISSADGHILNEIVERLPDGYQLRHRGQYDYRICGEGRGKINSIKKALEEIDLYGTGCETKTIPEIFFDGSYSQRLNLLRGLLDTDGSVDGDGGAISLTTVSLELAKDVQNLVWSLGGLAKMRQCKKTYTYNGEKRLGRMTYMISIRHPEPRSLFSLPRKIEKLSEDYQYADNLRCLIDHIEYVGEYDAQCIMVDHKDHLYITDDYVVTHNTAIPEGIARKINDGDVPETLKDATIYSLDLAALNAGASFRGEFEERVKAVVKALATKDNPILFIDEIHMANNSAGGQGSELSDLLKPHLARGELRCIGSTTFAEYRKHFEKDRAFARRFHKIDVHEPTPDETVEILVGLKSYFEEHHEVEYSEESLHAAVALTDRYITDRHLPDKAIEVIDAAGAAERVKPKRQRKKIITEGMIETQVAKVAKIPAQTVKDDESKKLARLEKDLKKAVYGQDDAIDILVDAVYQSRAGLRNPVKPQGNFLFAGPTGVGKTETAQQLAKTLGIELVRFDMSEYQEKHSVATLIGSRPGYVGYNDGDAGSGLLINEIEKNSHCVLLLDEIEKAHPDIYNILLQIMDHGTLTSGSGKKVNMRNVILIMTSNAGASELMKNTIGFGNGDGVDVRTHEEDAVINDTFKPEFRNRLDAIVKYHALSEKIMGKIVTKFMAQVNTLAASKGVKITLKANAKKWLAVEGYDPKMGARPLERVIQTHISQPLSREILFGSLSDGGEVVVGMNESKDGLSFEFSNKE